MSTSVIAAPQVQASDAPVEFLTPGVDVPQGLTSLPIAVASALQNPNNANGAAGGIVTASSAAASSSSASASTASQAAITAPPAPPAQPNAQGASASASEGQVETFTTSGSIEPGISSLPATASLA